MTRTVPAVLAAHDIPVLETYRRLAGPSGQTYATGVDVGYIVDRHPNTVYASLRRLTDAGLITQVHLSGPGRGIKTLTTVHA